MEPMDLRDKFACFLATGMAINEYNLHGRSGKIMAANAYMVADYMLEARGMTKEQRFEWALEDKEDVL